MDTRASLSRVCVCVCVCVRVCVCVWPPSISMYYFFFFYCECYFSFFWTWILVVFCLFLDYYCYCNIYCITFCFVLFFVVFLAVCVFSLFLYVRNIYITVHILYENISKEVTLLRYSTNIRTICTYILKVSHHHRLHQSIRSVLCNNWLCNAYPN